MIRTQISLDEQAYRETKAAARRQGISLAEFLRRAVRLALPPAPRGIGHGCGVPVRCHRGSRASESVDDVVYRRPRP